ncbi:MAG: 4-oxalocrotonate tautomerase [Gammaproteobacteria bacterium]|jgi:4-oxalocrotonate tautomerase|nr:4-oxalocrotonate tautomerase [Gammaproteobacteria bacterium]
MNITSLLVESTATILGKQRDVIAVALDYVPEDRWFVGGAPLSTQGKRTFYFDIKITEGTNTKDEIAEFIRHVFKGFEAILGELHSESYIYVQEVRGYAYGYGGLTQEHRYVAKNLSARPR